MSSNDGQVPPPGLFDGLPALQPGSPAGLSRVLPPGLPAGLSQALAVSSNDGHVPPPATNLSTFVADPSTSTIVAVANTAATTTVAVRPARANKNRVSYNDCRVPPEVITDLLKDNVAVSVQAENPKLPLSKSWYRYESYKRARNMQDLISLNPERSKARPDIENDMRKGFITVLDPFQAIKASRRNPKLRRPERFDEPTLALPPPKKYLALEAPPSQGPPGEAPLGAVDHASPVPQVRRKWKAPKPARPSQPPPQSHQFNPHSVPQPPRPSEPAQPSQLPHQFHPFNPYHPLRPPQPAQPAQPAQPPVPPLSHGPVNPFADASFNPFTFLLQPPRPYITNQPNFAPYPAPQPTHQQLPCSHQPLPQQPPQPPQNATNQHQLPDLPPLNFTPMTSSAYETTRTASSAASADAADAAVKFASQMCALKFLQPYASSPAVSAPANQATSITFSSATTPATFSDSTLVSSSIASSPASAPPPPCLPSVPALNFTPSSGGGGSSFSSTTSPVAGATSAVVVKYEPGLPALDSPSSLGVASLLGPGEAQMLDRLTRFEPLVELDIPEWYTS